MTVELSLDRVPVDDLARTHIGAILNEDARADFEAFLESFLGEDVTVTKMWGRQWGRIMEPNELPVGQHSLDATITYFPGTPYELQDQTGMTFDVSAPDSPACTG
jgi:hypothetical protein